MEEEAPTPEQTRAVTQTDPLAFPCTNCGATLTWDPESDALACDYCDHRVEVPRGEGTIVERGLEEAGNAARGLGLQVRVSKCQNCGARVTYDEQSTAASCVYCGSPTVLAQEANRNALRPESLVPLDVGKAQVDEHFKRWIGGLWFRPNSLKQARHFDATGVYVPYWTFDCEVHSNWSADAGHYYYVTRTVTVRVNGKPQRRTQRVRKIRWVPAWGKRDDSYDDILIPASAGLPAKLIAKVGTFETAGLVPYKPEYLAGWRAEEYQLDLEQGWERSEAQVVRTQKGRCGGDVPGDTYRNLRVENRIFDVRWKHVLLPLWSLQYRFKEKTYTVLVNGQTGQVAGDAPLSWVKILVLLLLIAVVILAIVFFANR